MFTWHHGFWLYFFTWRHPKVWQFVVGSMLPDYIYIIAVSVMLWKGQLSWLDLLHLSPTMMMSLLPMYPWVVKIDLLGHSLVVWGVAFLLTFLPIVNKIQLFVIGWGTHLLLDSFTHAAYANYFLYPISLMSVHSPISYWEPEYFAHEFKLVNGILIIVAASYLGYYWWKKKQQK